MKAFAKLMAIGERLSRITAGVLIPLVLVVFAAPFVGLMFCASLSVDDYAKAILAIPGYVCVRQPHILTAAWSEYTIGSGRFLANLIESTAMNKVNLSWGYGWLLLLVLVSNVLALAYFFANLFHVPRANALIAGGVVYVAWLATFYFPGENLFWLSGAFEYQLPITTLLIVGGLLCKSRQTVLSYIALAVLCLAIPAQHEIAGMLLLVCLLGGVIVAGVSKSPVRPWLFCLCIAAIGAGVIMFSPGMVLKMSSGHPTGGYLPRLLPHARHAVKDGMAWILNPTVLLAALCIPLLLWPHRDQASEYRPPRWLALVGLCAMCVTLGELANAEMSSGLDEFSPRVVGWFQLIFYVLLVCVVAIGLPEISRISFSTSSQIGIFALFALSLLTSANFHQAEKDWRGPARRWHRSNVARLTQHDSVVQLDALPPRPAMFLETGLSKNTGCWVNECFAVYLGANAVALNGPSENHWGHGNECSDPATK